MAELIVAADLVKRGFRVAFPFGEDCDWDLLFWRPPDQELERSRSSTPGQIAESFQFGLARIRLPTAGSS
jgi:hypothetical protein